MYTLQTLLNSMIFLENYSDYRCDLRCFDIIPTLFHTLSVHRMQTRTAIQPTFKVNSHTHRYIHFIRIYALCISYTNYIIHTSIYLYLLLTYNKHLSSFAVLTLFSVIFFCFAYLCWFRFGTLFRLRTIYINDI